MPGDQAVDWKIGDNVAIVDEDRVVFDPPGDVFNPAAGFQKNGFVKKMKAGPPVGLVREGLLPFPGQVVRVDCEICNPRVQAVIHHMGNEGTVLKRYQGFGQGVCERLEAGSEASAEKKSFSHGRRLR